MPAKSESTAQRQLNFRAIETAVLFALALLLVWKGILPGWRSLNTDFPNYYFVARLLREGYAVDRIYDWVWLQRIRDHWGIGPPSLIGFAGLTPFSAWPVLPFTVFSALTAKRIWIVLNLVFLGITAELLHRSTSLNRRRVWLITLLAFIPLQTSFLFGQMHILVMLLLMLAYYFLQRNRAVACGACIAFAGALKMYPLLFVLYFAWKKQYRFALATLVSVCVVVAAGLLSFGPHLLHIYAVQIVPSTLRAEAVDPYNIQAASAASLLHRLFLYEPSLNPRPIYLSPVAYAVLYPLFQLLVFLPLFALIRSASSPVREKLEWATFLLALLVASPFPASYHFVVLIPCIALFVDALAAGRNRTVLITALILYVLVSPASTNVSPRFATAIFILLSTARLWIGLAVLGLFLVSLRRLEPAPASSRLRIALLCSVSTVVLIASMVSWHTHLVSIQAQTSQLVRPLQPALLATGPAPQPGGGYLYTAMVGRGYRILDQNGRPVYTESGIARDQLSFAVFGSGDLLIELADATGSNIALVPRGSTPHIVLHDAESPAISADGRTIAFLREHKGRGSVWIAQFDGAAASEPKQVVPDRYEVRSVAFLPSGELVFTASTTESRVRIALYAALPGAAPRQLSAPGEEIDSVGAVPSRFIAITRLEHDHWQLGYLDPASGRETLLTHQDCNASAPSWVDADTLLYATDCARGYGLTALATARIQ